jgi:hypothetical protein
LVIRRKKKTRNIECGKKRVIDDIGCTAGHQQLQMETKNLKTKSKGRSYRGIMNIEKQR